MSVNFWTLLFSATIFTMSCKTAKNTPKTDISTTEKNEVSAIENLCRLRVSFGSIASGIDGESKAVFQDFVKKYEEKTGKKLAHEITFWGMEGERDYCFKLPELNAKEQSQFINDLKEAVKGKKQIFINENIEARQPRQAPKE